MTHDEMMSLLANTLADAAGHAGCLPILDCFSPHPGEEVTVSIPMCDDTVDIVLEDLDFPHEWEELLENSGADTMGDLVDYLCYCSQSNISLAISPEDEEKLYANQDLPDNGAAIFGMYATVEQPGEVAVGDSGVAL